MANTLREILGDYICDIDDKPNEEALNVIDHFIALFNLWDKIADDLKYDHQKIADLNYIMVSAFSGQVIENEYSFLLNKVRKDIHNDVGESEADVFMVIIHSVLLDQLRIKNQFYRDKYVHIRHAVISDAQLNACKILAKAKGQEAIYKACEICAWRFICKICWFVAGDAKEQMLMYRLLSIRSGS